jgi:hypothetical protein
MNRKYGKSKKIISNSNLNSNLNSDLFEENYGYDVSSTYRHNNMTEENNNRIKDSYLDKLQLKIEEQEKIINDLNNYKYLCEKRIKQLNPNEILPITSNSLKNRNNMVQQNNNDNNSYNQNINKKYELLNNKFEKLLNDYNEIVTNNNIHDTSSNTINIGNNSDRYKIMKEKYKKIKAENKKIIELLKEETKACEMQKNVIDVLQQAINSDICKNSNLKDYITVENIVDFTQLKMEAEQYRKELVLSQALVNSLKSEIELLNKEKKENNFFSNNNPNLNNNIDNSSYNYNKVNNNNEDHNLIMSENLSLKSTLNSQAQLIKELMEENQSLKKLVDEATIKLNDCISNKNENNLNSEKLNHELKSVKNEIKQYEDKFTYFNEYITTIKSIFMKFQESLPKFINIYNKLANEDLNSLLSNSFSQAIIKLNNRINQLNKIEKFNLETNIESDLTNIIMELLHIVNNEFISVYEKVFQTNCYYKESNTKVDELLLKLKENEVTNENNLQKINDMNDLLNNEKNNMLECKNKSEELKINLIISQIEKDNLNKKLEFYIDDKNIIINCYYIIIKALSIYNENLAQLIRETINIIETKSKLFNEKEIIMEQLTKNKIKDLNRNKIYQNNPEVNKMVTQEQITLQNLINEFDNKIKETEEQLTSNRQKINQSVLELQNKPILPKNNNGINDEYNYNYYIKTNENNGNNTNLENRYTPNRNKNLDMNFNYNNNNKNGKNITYALINNKNNIKIENQLDKNENDINSQANIY